MREYATPPTYELPASGNLTDAVVANARDAADRVGFLRRASEERAGGDWTGVTWAEFLDEVQATAKGLIGAGVVAGDRVALLSRTRYEWTVLDYAIWWAGAATVPIYETSSAEQVAWIIDDSAPHVVVVETAAHADRVPPGKVFVLDEGGLAELQALGSDVGDEALEAARTSRGPADIATLIYTSGTTGKPKGCELTHGNFLTELGVATGELSELFTEDARTLLFLPLAHVFARIIQIGCVQERTVLGHSGDIRHLTDDLGSFRPTFLLAVPRVFEKVFNTASQRATADGRGAVFNRAADVAISWSRALDGRGPSLALRVQHALFDRLVYSRLRASLGGHCEHAISGGAPLGDRLGHFYRGIGLTILEGYGLTETTAALCVNLPDAIKIGTVGRPIPGTTFRVADDGELLVRGGQVFSAYWRNEAATAEVIDPEGWFHTGDIGEIDDEGFVRITGRKKEIIVTAGGKNVAPAGLEDRLRAHALVSQALVVGDGQPFIGALITLDPETVGDWAERHGKTGTLTALAGDPDVVAEVQAAVDDANRSVSKAESIRKFRILPEDWTEEGGQLTPSLKLKRSVVMRECREEIRQLYL